MKSLTNRSLYLSTVSLSIGFSFASYSRGFTELEAIQFKPGHPLYGESISDALETPTDEQRKSLEANLKIIAKAPRIRVEIMGFADRHECVRSECDDLSLRRAKCVYDWLVAQGITKERLKGPTGNGVDWPIDQGDTEEDWRYNRRVQFDFVGLATN